MAGAYLLLKYLIIAFYLLSAESRSASDPALGSSPKISLENKKEIDQLRTELKQALEEDEVVQAGKGIIVQPKWLQEKDSKTFQDSKVVVTKQGLDEVKALRDEIQKAVAEDAYVASVASISGGDTKKVKELERTFDLQKDGSELLDTLVTSSGSSEQVLQNNKQQFLRNLSNNEDEEEFVKAGPNIAESYSLLEPDIDLRKLQKLEISKRRTREVLILKSIEEDFSFNLGEDVLAWAHIIHAGEEYFIGRRLTDLLIVRKNSTKYDNILALPIGQQIFFLETYSFWNKEQKQQEGVILVGLLDKILWFRVKPESRILELYWEWNIGFHISSIKYFNIDMKTYIAVGMGGSSQNGQHVINIYQFKLKEKEYWIAQQLPLENAFGEVAFLDSGRDLILAVPSNHSAKIYTFNPNVPALNHLHFQFLRNVVSEDIGHILAFKMGGQSYLALGGRRPQILLYQQGDFISKTILGQNFGLVELFFPIPVRTYRDDLLLLVQHRVEFSTHSLTVLETLIWDGDVFETSIPVPCKIGSYTDYGVSCMLDINRDEGLRGAALLRMGQEVSIIVPRNNAESGLFRLKTQLLAKNSQLLDLKEIFDFLKDWVKEQDELIAEAQKILGTTADINDLSQKPIFDQLDSLKTPELSFNGEIGKIYLNEYEWTEKDTNTDLEFVIQTIEDLEQDLRNTRNKRALNNEELVFDSLDFDLLEVDSLFIEKLNDRQFFIQNGVLNFDGILNLHDLEVREQIKGRVQREVEPSIEINENIQFDHINGIPWNTLKENFVSRIEPFNIEDLELDGELVCEKTLDIKNLNKLQFPEDYLWSSGPSASTIKAEKIFTNNLVSNIVDTDGFINGVNPIDAISLYSVQDWFGSPTFSSLEITEKFELNGTTRGKGLRNFPINPILEETNATQAACLFNHLEVRGPIFVENSFEDETFHGLNKHVVQKNNNSNEPLEVHGTKLFSQVEFPIDFHLSEDTLNNISINAFIPKHTKQNLSLEDLEGYIYFHNLALDGLYDGVNITDMMNKAIKINSAQNLADTQLNFAEEVKGSSFRIEETLNGVPLPRGFQTIDDAITINKAHFDFIEASLVNSPKDVLGKSKLNSIDLEDFLSQKSWNEANNKNGNIFVRELFLSQPLQSDELHGIDTNLVLEFLHEIDDLPAMILADKIHVNHVVITGDVLVSHLNNQNFDEDIQMTAVWLNRPNFLNTNLRFKEVLEVKGNLVDLGDFNGENLVEIVEDLVFKNENQTAVIVAPKHFLKDVIVQGNTRVEAVNGIPMDSIANTKSVLQINGSFLINANLFIKSLNVEGSINNFQMEKLREKIHFDPSRDAFILKGDNLILGQHHLNDLSVYGKINSFYNISEFFEQMIYKNQMLSLKGNTTFTGRVTIEKGAFIKNLKEYNLITLLNNIVLKNSQEPVVIKSRLNFSKEIHLQDLLIKETLATSKLNHCDLTEWFQEALIIDKDLNISVPLRFSPSALDMNNIEAIYLNGVNLTEIITLNSWQNVTKPFHFSELYLDGEVEVKGLTNDVDLSSEYENTLLNNGYQHIETPLTLPSIEVYNNLEISIPVNGDKDLNDLALLNENIHFKTPLYFQNVSVDNLNTFYEISGINLETWMEKALLKKSPREQVINGSWSIGKLVIKTTPQMPVQFGPLINYESSARISRGSKGPSTICHKIKSTRPIHKNQKNNFPSIKSLEKSFTLVLKNQLARNSSKVFTLQHENNKFILVNSFCWSSLYIWNITDNNFSFIEDIESGPIKEVFVLINEKKNENLRFTTIVDPQKESFCKEKARSFKKEHSKRSLTPSKVFKLEKDSISMKEELLNETHFSSLTKLSDESKERLVRSKLFLENKYSLPLFYKRTNVKFVFLKNDTSNILPNHFSYEDFREALQNVFSDINYRLDLEVKITQLSIPENDLYDEQLIQDFITILQEIEKQTFYPSDLFSNFSIESLDIPENPAQVLAARAVQIVWPFIKEIEELHALLEDNSKHNHVFCFEISKTLGTFVNDILSAIRNHQAQFNNRDHFNELNSIIERIRIFQKQMKHLSELLESNSEKDQKSQESSLSQIVPSQNLEKPAEAFQIEVGSDKLPSSLHAVPIHIKDPLKGEIDLINFYLPFKNNSLFQSLKVKEPKFFTTIRLNNESLLVFVEKKNIVRVLLYRGIQGFVEFSKFKISKNQEIVQLFQISLPNKTKKLQHFLAVVMRKIIIFYEIVFEKIEVPSEDSILCL